MNGNREKLTTACYAPTNEAEDGDKDSWCEELQAAVLKVPPHEVLLNTGNMKAKVGFDNTNFERVLGRHDCALMNDNGRRIAEFFSETTASLVEPFFHVRTYKSYMELT